MVSLKRIALLTMAGVAVLGSNYVYARIVPGYDRPYDPPNYYSETSISWADTYNPSYFFIDLKRQGMKVHDVPRDGKNKKSLQNTLEYLNVFIEQVNNKITDMTGMLPEKSDQARKNVEFVSDNTTDVHRASKLPNIDEQDMFRSTDTAGDPRRSFSREEQYKWMDKTYKEFLVAAHDSMKDEAERAGALNEAVQNSIEARGDVAANQANTETAALYAAEISRRNAMLSNYAALEAAHDMAEKDKALKAAEEMKNGMAFRVADPYSPAQTDKTNYARPAGLGFIDFK